MVQNTNQIVIRKCYYENAIGQTLIKLVPANKTIMKKGCN